MFRTIVRLASFYFCLCGLMTTASYGQLLGLYEFDGGGNGTSWSDAANWEQKTDPFGNPISGDPATPPNNVTSADIPLTGVVVSSAGQTALDVNVGTAAGAGSLSISSGDLTGRDVNVGSDGTNANTGSLNISGGTLVAGDDITISNGSVGSMTMSSGLASTGDDFFINAGGSLVMTGGQINVGDRLVTSGNAILNVDGGTIIADDDFFFFDDTAITVDSGLMEVADKMRFDFDSNTFSGPKLTINGGIVRTQEYHFNITTIDDFLGVTEINGDGLLQVRQGDGSTQSELTIRMARDLIAEGVHLITSESAPKQLGAFSVVVPSSLQGTNVVFTQISVVPEPASALLLGFGAMALVIGRKRLV